MPPSVIPTRLPDIVYSGDSLYFIVPSGSYSEADGWVMSFEFNGLATISSSNSIGDHLFNIPASSTSVWPSGDYTWRSYVTKTTPAIYSIATPPVLTTAASIERYSIGTGTVSIRDASYQSTARKMLDKIDAYLSGNLAFDALQWTSKSLGDMHVTRANNTDDIIKARAYWQTVYNTELQKEKLSNGQTINNHNLQIRFVKT